VTKPSEPILGVLLTNLGSPDAPTASALRRYLAQFLWDRRVVDLPRPLWWLILHGIILRVRPARSARLYSKVWTKAGSPLMVISRRQCESLQQRLEQQFPGRIKVALGMRYGNPSLGAALHELREAGAQRILVLPLYPQNSCATTASTFDAVAEEMRSWRALPELRFVADYHADSGYISALAASVQQAWTEREPAQRLLFSFHGTPQRFRVEGDPYYEQCMTTARLTAQRLGLDEARWQVSFQSRFGREPWLQPYTDVVLEALPGGGTQSVDVICPGFSADCLETLEEIAQENRELFLSAGGQAFHYIPALNDGAAHIAALSNIVTRHLRGWLTET